MSEHFGPGAEVLFDQIQWGRGSVWECGRCHALVHLDGQGGHVKWHRDQDRKSDGLRVLLGLAAQANISNP